VGQFSVGVNSLGLYLPGPKSEGGRALSKETIALFDVRVDEQGFACFAHTNLDGHICGWERKCRPDPAKMAQSSRDEKMRTTQFLTGGRKRLFITHIDPGKSVKRIVVLESAIDALAHAQMFGGPREIYISHSGRPSNDALNQLKELLLKHPSSELVLAHDNDETGNKLAAIVKELAPSTMQVTRETPNLKDWNEDLQQIDEMRRKEDLMIGRRR